MARSGFGRKLLLGLVMVSAWPVIAVGAGTATEAIPNHPALNDDFTFAVGIYYPKSSTAASLQPSSGGVGVVLDFEDTLALEDRSLVPMTEFLWRITDRWRLEAEYFRLNRDATRTIDQQIDFGDQTYLVGDTVNSTFNFSDLRVSGGYSFFKTRDKELGVGFGLHMTAIKLALDNQAGTQSEAADVLAPLPVFSIYGAFALTDEWALKIRGDWLSLTYGDYSGDVTSTALDVLYQPWRNVGFGLGARNFIIDLEIDTTDWKGRARTAFRGPTLYVYGSF